MEQERACQEALRQAMDIGEQMLISGAEIGRVEDSVERICKARGAERVDVFTITSSMIVTVYDQTAGAFTQTRRIRQQGYDLNRLECLNALSREICADALTLDQAQNRLFWIGKTKQQTFRQQVLLYALISGSFSLFFGGSWRDAVAAALIGMFLRGCDAVLQQKNTNAFLQTFLCSFLGGLLAGFSVWIGFGQAADKISIGNIMLLIPGIALTNSIRDMFSGDMISGLLRSMNALLLAVVIALGFALAAIV
ncbi:MAG: threonine/serine exporter family protein [Oscillospiraceae bacterium]|nr:threonine/serine exporter family protein [Oscillospiraceae bacterium]